MIPPRTRHHSARARAVAMVVLWLLSWALPGGLAQAAPVRDLAALPAELGTYVPHTAAWAASAWMTSPTCADRGGDFSIWVAQVLADTPALLAFFQSSVFGPDARPQDRPRADAILAGYRAVAAEQTAAIPGGYCVDELRRVAPSPPTKPFGIAWGLTEGDGHQTTAYCTDRDPDTTRATEINRHVGAERAPCDGFFLTCADTGDAGELARCREWNAWSDRYVLQVQRVRNQAIADHPTSGGADTDLGLAGPGDLAEDAAQGWFRSISVAVAAAAATLMAEAMTWWTRTDRAEMLASSTIPEIQSLLAYVGYALLAAGVMWQGILLMVRRKAEPLLTMAHGLLSFVGWSTLGATVAVMLNEAGVALSGHVLDDSIDGFAGRMSRVMQVNTDSSVALVFMLSIVLFLLAGVQWLLGFFRIGAVAILLALIPTAAAGQLTERTKPWLPKTVGWCLALILYQPIAAVIYAIGFRMMGDGQDIATILVGTAILAMAVVAMPALFRFFDWGGQRLVPGGGGGAPMAVGAVASVLGGAGGFGRFMDSHGPAASSGSGTSSGATEVTPAHHGDGPATSRATAPAPAGGGAPGGGAQVTAATDGAASGAAASPAATGGAAGGAAAGGPVGAVVTAGVQVAAGATDQAVRASTDSLTDGER